LAKKKLSASLLELIAEQVTLLAEFSPCADTTGKYQSESALSAISGMSQSAGKSQAVLMIVGPKAPFGAQRAPWEEMCGLPLRAEMPCASDDTGELVSARPAAAKVDRDENSFGIDIVILQFLRFASQPCLEHLLCLPLGLHGARQVLGLAHMLDHGFGRIVESCSRVSRGCSTSVGL
jgi:hypothetical protein